MKSVLISLPGFLGRHWLRVLIIGGALLIVSRKQMNVNVRLGGVPAEYSAPLPTNPPGAEPEGEGWRPAPGTQPAPAPVAEEAPASFLSGLFGGEDRAAEPEAAVEMAAAERTVRPAQKGFLERFSLFGAAPSNTALYDRLSRMDEATVAAFIRRFSHVAQAEQEKFGIPASITLANGLLHTNSGTSASAQELNNFFAIRCGSGWNQGCERAEGLRLRRYETAWTSFRDHSQYITTGRYAPMTQFSATDYRRWAAGLAELNYNGTPELARQLTQTIERFQLFRFDH